jgi:hypothetical protein
MLTRASSAGVFGCKTANTGIVVGAHRAILIYEQRNQMQGIDLINDGVAVKQSSMRISVPDNSETSAEV